MKRAVFVATIFATAVFAAFAANDRYCPESDFDITVFNYGRAVEIIRYVGNNSEVRIPTWIQGLPVTAIGGSAFQAKQLTSVSIPDSVTFIGEGAFWGNRLTGVTIPDSVTVIDELAFAGNRLTEVSFGNSVRHIGVQAFWENQLTGISIPDSVTFIGSWAFAKNLLTDVSVPGGAFVGSMAFSSGVTVTRRYSPEVDFDVVTFNEGVSALLMRYFGNNEIVHIPPRVRDMPIIRIGDGAFWRTRVTNVTISYGIRIIGGGAFAESQLTGVSISDSVTHIRHSAFWGNQLTSVEIPDSVVYIGNRAFRNNLLTSVSVPSHTEVHPYAFDPGVTVTRR